LKGKVALVVAIVLGLVAAWGVRNYLRQKKVQFEQKIRFTKVVVAKRLIKHHEEIQYDQLAFREIPEDSVTRDHILWRDHPLLVKQKLDRNVERGDFVLKSYVVEERRTVGTMVPAKHVAVSLRVDDVAGVAGALRPGLHVDILATLPVGKGPRGGGGMITKRLLTNVTVLAVDNRTSPVQPALSPYGKGLQGYSTVTLALTPQEALIVMFVRSQGQVVLALRNPDDIPAPSEREPSEVSLQNVLRLAEQANAARKAHEAPPKE